MRRKLVPPEVVESRPSSLLDALRPLNVRERAFVRFALSGDSYEVAARSAKYRGAFSVLDLLGRAHVARALQHLAPLIPDEAHARRLLAPFALQAQAAILAAGGPVGAATRASAAREITSPAAALDPRRMPSRSGAAGPPSSLPPSPGGESAWDRAKRAAAERRARALVPFANALETRPVSTPDVAGFADGASETETARPADPDGLALPRTGEG